MSLRGCIAWGVVNKKLLRITLIPELLEDLQCFQTMLYSSYLVAIFVCCHRNGGLAEKLSIYF